MVDDAYLVAKLNMQGAEGVVIKNGIFYSCKSTPNFLHIPKGVVALNSGCLSGQDNLISVTLPDTLNNIGFACFANCPILKQIRCRENCRVFESNIKYGNNGEVIYVSSIREK